MTNPNRDPPAVHHHRGRQKAPRGHTLGGCGHHVAPRTLIGNAFRQGFYRPTAIADAIDLVCSCHGCQFYAKQTHLLMHALQMIPITWPFVVWGLDLMGSLHRTTGGYTHLLVAIDMFSKWIKARPITNICSEQVVLFFTDITHCFGVPNVIIPDNGTQFTGNSWTSVTIITCV